VEPSDFALLVNLDALLQEGSVTKAAHRVGLSTPAMSHALARMRERLDDPLLVRAGRSMVLTPRAEALRPRVRSVVAQASQALSPEQPFSARELSRSFVIHATDHVLTVIGVALDKLVHSTAPQVSLRFVANTPDDAGALRDGSSDLAVGIYAHLPSELRTRVLMTDRHVCVVRADHPSVKKRLSLEQFLALEHVQVAPRGKPGGYVDDVLSERGLSRRVVRAVPFFLAALRLTASTDYVLTVSERIARTVGPCLGLQVFEPPLALRAYALSLVWHPRFDGDPGHAWLRDAFVRAAKVSAGDLHPDARKSLALTKASRTKKRRSSRD
jgi:DNA-binding transcriptional LysR family regulator